MGLGERGVEKGVSEPYFRSVGEWGRVYAVFRVYACCFAAQARVRGQGLVSLYFCMCIGRVAHTSFRYINVGAKCAYFFLRGGFLSRVK